MARPVTLTQLIARIRRRADKMDDPSVTDADITDIINGSSWPELYDLRIRGYGNEVDATAWEQTTAADHVVLPEDFYQLRGLFAHRDGESEVWPLKRATDAEYARLGSQTGRPEFYMMVTAQVLLLPAPDATYVYQFIYYPAATVLSSGSDTIDDVNGWSEFIVVDAAIQLLQAEESDVSTLMAQKEMLKQRIMQAAANRDQATPARVTDVQGDADPDLRLVGFY